MGEFCSVADYANRDAVVSKFPSAERILKVSGGWVVFATYDDFYAWNYNYFIQSEG